MIKDEIIVKPRRDPERDALVHQLDNARSRLDDIEAEQGATALAACEGDATAFRTYSRLDKEANQLNQQVEIFERAIKAFDRSRAEAEEAKQADRIAAANERRAQLLENAYHEQREHMEATIARLDNTGQKREADLWRGEVANLRKTLEKQFPPVGLKPRGPSMVVGITNTE